MSPDTQHEQYFKLNPTGNHDMPADETVRFMERQLEINEIQRKTNESFELKIDTLIAISTEMKVIMEFVRDQVTKTNGRVTKLEEEREKREEKFLTKEEFLPIRNLVYGFVFLVLSAVIGSLLSLVVA